MELCGGGVLNNPLRTAAARDGNDMVALRENPGEGKLTDRGVHRLGEGRKLGGGLQVPLEVPRLPARVKRPHVVGLVLGGWPGRAGEEAAAERGVGHQPDPEFFHDREHLLHVPLEE